MYIYVYLLSEHTNNLFEINESIEKDFGELTDQEGIPIL